MLTAGCPVILKGIVQGNQFGRTSLNTSLSISIAPNKSCSIGSAVRDIVGIASISLALQQRLDAPKQNGAVEHRLLVVGAGGPLRQRELLEKGFAQVVRVLGREPLEAGSPHGMIDSAPDRLDVKALAGHLLEFGTEGFERFQACTECRGDVGGDFAALQRQANRFFLPRRSPRGNAPPMKSVAGIPTDHGSDASSRP